MKCTTLKNMDKPKKEITPVDLFTHFWFTSYGYQNRENLFTTDIVLSRLQVSEIKNP